MPPTHNILLYKGKIYIQREGEPKPSIRKKKRKKIRKTKKNSLKEKVIFNPMFL